MNTGKSPERSHSSPANPDAEQISSLEEYQDQELFERVFGIQTDPPSETVIRKLKLMMLDSDFAFPRTHTHALQRGLLKYTQAQIEAGEWDPADVERAAEALQEELLEDRVHEYFVAIAGQYEQHRPIHDSIVRLDQEAAIAQTLEDNTPVLVRGVWRMGKTSMIESLNTHRSSEKGHSLVIDAQGEYKVSRTTPIDEFRRQFGARTVSHFLSSLDADRSYQPETATQSPFEFLNSVLQQREEILYLSIDEVIKYYEDPAKLHYIASLAQLSNIRLSVVLHRIAPIEDVATEAFGDFETYYVRALSLDEVALLVRRPLEGTHVTFTNEAIQRIFEFTGGRPIEVNHLCRNLLIPSFRSVRPTFTYDAADIDQFTQRSLYALYEAGIQNPQDNAKHVYASALSKQEQDLIAQIATSTSPGVPASEVDKSAVQPLIDITYVKETKQPDGTVTYQINGELLHSVLRSLHP